MTEFVLDTDIISLFQHGDRIVTEHVETHDPDEVAATIISVEEHLSGWYTLLRRAKSPSEFVPVYEQMRHTIQFYNNLQLLTFTDAAAPIYERLRKQKGRTGSMDLRIAAIALSIGAAVVTRNISDFSDIDGLQVLDWSRP